MAEGTMRAIVLDGPGDVGALHLRRVPVPVARPGEVLIRIRAFGLNRSELHTRLGLAEGVTFPRVPGIEATGVVESCPGGEYQVGQQVATMMGGMGRTFDGGYADYTLVPSSQVIPFESDLPWSILGAVPEMLQTAHGSLTVGLDYQAGQTLLIRGGTSSVGLAVAILARLRGLTVLATTRDLGRSQVLEDAGVDHVLLDDGSVSDQVRALSSGGVDIALELVGTPTLRDTLRSTRVHGTVCFAGMLSNAWTVDDFYPIDYIPYGVRLTSYAGESTNLPSEALQGFLDAVATGVVSVPIGRVYAMEDIRAAHSDLESGAHPGKLVVVT